MCMLLYFFLLYCTDHHRDLHSFPTRRSSDLDLQRGRLPRVFLVLRRASEHAESENAVLRSYAGSSLDHDVRSEEHTSELQSRRDLVCRLLLEKKKKITAVSIHLLIS